MKPKEKQILYIDLSGRLPYGVMVVYHGKLMRSGVLTEINAGNVKIGYQRGFSLGLIKPYLRPMSKMTEWEIKELEKLLGRKLDFKFNETEAIIYINWLNKHMFDYRGLIGMGLALEAPDDMYKFSNMFGYK